MRAWILLAISAAAAIAAAAHGPVIQDQAYHAFADARSLLGIPNFADVVSNLPFLLVGLHGLARRRRGAAYAALCGGVLLVSAGSAYYHWSPSDETLLWDRLPMTIAFMGLFAAVLEDGGVARPSALRPLLAAGLLSVVYWRWTGDLRPYFLVQFLPLLLMPAILALYERSFLDGRLLLAGFGLYVAAKVLEHYDGPVLAATGLLSGHTLKHLLAAAAALCLVRSWTKEEPCFSD